MLILLALKSGKIVATEGRKLVLDRSGGHTEKIYPHVGNV